MQKITRTDAQFSMMKLADERHDAIGAHRARDVLLLFLVQCELERDQPKEPPPQEKR